MKREGKEDKRNPVFCFNFWKDNSAWDGLKRHWEISPVKTFNPNL